MSFYLSNKSGQTIFLNVASLKNQLLSFSSNDVSDDVSDLIYSNNTVNDSLFEKIGVEFKTISTEEAIAKITSSFKNNLDLLKQFLLLDKTILLTIIFFK